MEPTPTPEYKTCPKCAESVRSAAIVCRFCGYKFKDVPRPVGERRLLRATPRVAISKRVKQVAVGIVAIVALVVLVTQAVDWFTKDPTIYADGFAIAGVLTNHGICTDRTPSELFTNCTATFKGAPQQVEVRFATPVELSSRFEGDECYGLTQEGGYYLFRDGQNWVGYLYGFPPDHSDKTDPDPAFADSVASALVTDIHDC